MLKKKFKIQKEKEIREIFKKSKKVFLPDFFVYFRPNNLSFSRCLVIVGLKISKKSSQRNKIRRRCYAVLELFYPFIKPGYDIIFVGLKSLIQKDFSEIKNEIFYFLKKNKLLNESFTN